MRRGSLVTLKSKRSRLAAAAHKAREGSVINAIPFWTLPRRSSCAEPLSQDRPQPLARTLMPRGRARVRRAGETWVCAPAGGACVRGLVAVGGVDPPIVKSQEKLSRLLIGGLLRACRAFSRLLPAVSDLFSHHCPRPLELW